MLIITVLALLMAATMGWLAVRLLREEQRRSDARIAALAAALDTPSPVLGSASDLSGASTDVLHLTRVVRPDHARPAATARLPEFVSIEDTGADHAFASEAAVPPRPTPAHVPSDATHEAPRPAAVRHDAAPPVVDAPESRPHDEAAGDTRPLFGGADAPRSGDDRRWLAVAAVVVAFLLAGVVLWNLGRSGDGAATTVSAQAAAPQGIPLELAALGHDQKGRVLVVRGLVRNPPAASARANTYVQVRLFDEAGSPLGSERGVLDVPSLVPGDEATFAVELPADPRVRRYRVTFRDPDGNLVPHVDVRAGARPQAG